jgi:virginiamycin B lyase
LLVLLLMPLLALAGALARPALPVAAVTAEFPIPSAVSQPESIILGADGNLWYTETLTSRVGRLTPGGTATLFPLPALNEQGVRVLRDVGATTDGPIWVVEDVAETDVFMRRLGRLAPGGAAVEFHV